MRELASLVASGGSQDGSVRRRIAPRLGVEFTRDLVTRISQLGSSVTFAERALPAQSLLTSVLLVPDQQQGCGRASAGLVSNDMHSWVIRCQ